MRLNRSTRRLDAGVLRAGGFASPEWIVPRAVCRFQRIVFAGVPVSQRDQALAMQLRQADAASQSSHCIAWQADAALVWTWDAPSIEAALEAEGIRRERLRYLPESLLYQPQPAAGLHLVSCHIGVEGQYWREGRLLASRWWPQAPDVGSWLNFQRDAGAPPDVRVAAVPSGQTLPLREKPWATPAPRTGASLVWGGESLWIRAIAILLIALTAWPVIEWIKIRDANADLASRLLNVEAAAFPLQQARGQALDYLARINALDALAPYPPQLAAMGQMAALLPTDGSTLREWDYQHGKLKIGLQSSSTLPAGPLIDKLQGSGWFRAIQTLPANAPVTLVLEMELIPRAEIKP